MELRASFTPDLNTMTQPTSQSPSVSSLPYAATGFYNDIVLDYVSGDQKLRPFYQHAPSWEGIEAAIQTRKQAPVNRKVLVEALEQQYKNAGLTGATAVDQSIQLLAQSGTYTVCTAHQPNLFTGYLYFVYKILHAIRLANSLKERYPDASFVPVFYMGSEDADLDELGKINLGGEKLVWDTKQRGAVGRMQTKGLEPLLHRIEGELSVLPYGPQLLQLLKSAYLDAADIQTATFRLIHALFSQYGLVVLIADQPQLKKIMLPVFEDDLFNQTPSAIVTETVKRLAVSYKVQANPRAINLFYLKDDIRNRIEKTDTGFSVVDTDLQFTEDEMKQELELYPERFSPNVILRGLYQETILPNIAFIGGGGELAYWLELKELFDHYKVSYPVQVLRNSFLLVPEKQAAKIERMGFTVADFFQSTDDLMNQLVKRDSSVQVHLSSELRDSAAFYQHLQTLAGKIDATLVPHVQALEKQLVHRLKELEKKMIRAEKRKFSDEARQLQAIRTALFPNNSLQERFENVLPYYAQYGPAFIDLLYAASPALEQEFRIMNLEL
jgi:bacillithiol biosynthesis cysteine-adding enzyme BshC